MQKGQLIPLIEYYDKNRAKSESVYKFIQRKIEEGVFTITERGMYKHFKAKTGFVFREAGTKEEKFLLESPSK